MGWRDRKREGGEEEEERDAAIKRRDRERRGARAKGKIHLFSCVWVA